MKRIDSDALSLVNRSMGLTGAGSPQTELHDGEVFQTLDVARLVRRGRTVVGSGGLFTVNLENAHTGAQSLNTSVDPYAQPVGVIPPYPSPVPLQFDIWLLWATIQRKSGSGSISALLDANFPGQGFGEDDGGAAVVANDAQPLAHWDALVSEGIQFLVLAGSEQPRANLNFRMPRPTAADTSRFRFRSTSSATSTYAMTVVLGMFPTAMGQDGAF